MRNSKAKGFTLIELIVVMAIIGVLAAILVPSMIGYLNDSKFSKANANAKQVYQSAASWATKCETNSKPAKNVKLDKEDITSGNTTLAGKQNEDIEFDGTSSTDLAIAMVVYMGGQKNSGNATCQVTNSACVWAQWDGAADGTDEIFGEYPEELNANKAKGKSYGTPVGTYASAAAAT